MLIWKICVEFHCFRLTPIQKSLFLNLNNRLIISDDWGFFLQLATLPVTFQCCVLIVIGRASNWATRRQETGCDVASEAFFVRVHFYLSWVSRDLKTASCCGSFTVPILVVSGKSGKYGILRPVGALERQATCAAGVRPTGLIWKRRLTVVNLECRAVNLEQNLLKYYTTTSSKNLPSPLVRC